MRLVLKSLFKAITALLTIAVMAFTLMPATDSEAAALGRDNNRFNLIQMRLAKTMMTVAPDMVVARYAEATGLPPSVIRAHLNAKAAGEPIIPHQEDLFAGQGQSTRESGTSKRRVGPGGSLFVRPD
ncbi:hypothetical protein SAMN04488515_2428 [Cognatiyoonia koreensis]|uniref:Uncharacterized protein n=1 Tax=Cognatiyoonia koreensis TaxID=364200 RepID=A0A1I0RB72_9RHOB|nr:hypothetical protein [Cognatiyoonia koreensis]SEW38077.1 hypothetical protein SAMN04488515_2428 [Cognatiyoonia koreensis]